MKILNYFKKLVIDLNRRRLNRKPWIEIGAGTYVYLTTSFTATCKRGGVIRMGKDGRLGLRQKQYWAGFCPPTQLCIWGDGAQITIGDRCALNGVSICARKRVEMGNDCIFAGGIQILDSDTHQVLSTNRRKDLDEPKPVVIGNNVWVGLNAIILKGTQIGDNCVVGAGAIVKGVFPPNCVIAGNPARVVKDFTEQINALNQ